MNHARGLAAAALTLAGPGYGAAIAGRSRRAIVELAAVFVVVLVDLWTPWATWLALALYVATVVDGYWCAARAEHVEWFAPVGGVAIGGSIVAALALRTMVLEPFVVPSSSMYPTLEIGDHFWLDKLSLHWRAVARGDVIVFRYPCDRERDYVKRVIALGGDAVEVRCGVLHVNGVAQPRTLVEDGATCRYEDRYEGDGAWSARPCSRYREELGGRVHDIFHQPEQPDRERRRERSVHDFPSRDRSNLVPSCHDVPRGFGEPAVAREQTLGRLVEAKPADAAQPCELQMHYVVPDGHVFVMGDNRDNANDSRVWGGVPEDDVKGRVVGIWLSNGHGFSLRRVGRVD